jgi:hypothetical protein
VGYLIEATTSRSAALAEPAASLLEDLHVLFVDRYPEAARQAREALIAKGVLVAVPASFPERALRLLLPHEWRSKEEILSSWGPVKRPEVLRKVGQFLSRDQPDAVRRGAARWLDELTDGQIRVDPKDVDLDELTRVLAGPWTWDEGRETFTLPSM